MPKLVLQRDFFDLVIQFARRMAELLAHLVRHHPETQVLRGSSWLYNIQAYRRLFPDEYIQNSTPTGYPLHRMALL